MTRGDGLAVVLYVVLAIATGFVDLRVRPYPDHGYTKYVPGVIDGTYGAPGIYRVLVPYSFDWLVRTTGIEPSTLWHLSRLLLLFGSYVTFHWYLRTWTTVGGAVGGTAIVAALLPMTFTNSWAHPDHFAELLLFTAGCAAVARNREGLFAGVLLLASLNRETAVFLVLLYLVVRPLSMPHLVRTAAFGALWALVFVGLRAWRGFEHYEYWQLGRNLEFLRLLPPPRDPYYRAYAWFGVVAFAPLLWIASRARGAQPVFVRRALWVVPVIALVAFTISSIIESRIFTPLFPLVVPAVVCTFTEPAHAADPLSGTRI
jgi:hypothetical protein